MLASNHCITVWTGWAQKNDFYSAQVEHYHLPLQSPSFHYEINLCSLMQKVRQKKKKNKSHRMCCFYYNKVWKSIKHCQNLSFLSSVQSVLDCRLFWFFFFIVSVQNHYKNILFVHNKCHNNQCILCLMAMFITANLYNHYEQIYLFHLSSPTSYIDCIWYWLLIIFIMRTSKFWSKGWNDGNYRGIIHFGTHLPTEQRTIKYSQLFVLQIIVLMFRS